LTGRGDALRLPLADGTLVEWRPSGTPPVAPQPGGFRSRMAYAATHVTADPRADNSPDGPAAIDWEATLAYRRHIWSLGLGVAEAMDTAQRGGGLGWVDARTLIGHTIAEAAHVGGRTVCGVTTDQLAGPGPFDLGRVTDAYLEQLAFVEGLGGSAIVMASRAMAATARSAEDYLRVYEDVLAAARRPVMIHWLGVMFDPALAGYWGSVDPQMALDTVVDIVASHPDRVDGVKISMLDSELEIVLRRRLPAGVVVYTGDDLDFVDLILGDERGHSHALLGAFDAIAPAAAAALQALDAGDTARYRSILEPTLPLARHVFAPPTDRYKTGVVFLAYLNGHQTHVRMVGGAESGRSVVHLARVLVLADRAGTLVDPEQAVHRMRPVLALAGID
jgi:Protein of unknown function (DUF993)